MSPISEYYDNYFENMCSKHAYDQVFISGWKIVGILQMLEQPQTNIVHIGQN
jgi:hypothetical protein